MGKVKAIVAAGVAAALLVGCSTGLTGQTQFANKSFLAAQKSSKATLASSWFGFLRNDALAAKAWSHFMLGNQFEANAAFKELELRGERPFEAYLGQAWTLSKLGETQEALRYLWKANDEASEYNRYLVEDARAWALLNEGRLDDAARVFKAEPNVYGEWQESTPDYLVGLGWIELRKNSLNEARAYFERGLELDRTCHYCRDGLARTALKAGDYQEVLEQAYRGLTSVDYDKGLVTLFETGLANTRDYQTGEKMLQHLARLHDHVTFYPLRLAQFYQSQGYKDEAQRWYEVALERDEENVAAKNGLNALQVSYADISVADLPSRQAATRGYRALAEARYEDAAREFSLALEMEPGLITAERGIETARWTHYNQAWAAILAGNYASVEALLLQAEATLPEEGRWRLEATRGWMAYGQGDYGTARDYFEKAVSEGDDPHLAEAGLAMIAIDEGDFEAPAATLTTAFAADPLIPNLYCQMAGDKLIDVERYLEAYALLAACYESQGSLGAIQLRLADLHFRLGDEGMGKLRLFDALNKTPILLEKRLSTMYVPTRAAKEVRSALAWNHYFAKRYRQALTNFNHVLRYDGEDKKALRGRGFVYFKLKDYGRAIGDLIQVFDQEPRRLTLVAEYLPIPGTDDQWTVYYNAHTTAAWAALKLNRATLAAQAFMRAIRDYPELVDAYAGLGYAMMQNRDYEAAGQAFDRALELSPSYPDAVQGKKQLEQLRGS